MATKINVDADKLSSELKITLLVQGAFGEKDIDKLSKDEDIEVRMYVAKCPNASEKAMENLAGDDDLFIKTSVAGHFKTNERTLQKLAEDENPLIRMEVAKAKNCSENLLKQLTKDSCSWVVKEANYQLKELRKKTPKPE